MNAERCAAGIVFAIPNEADAFARLAADRVETWGEGLQFHEATVAGHRVAWCIAGVGQARAAWATQLLIDGHRPRRLVSAGFAGGLDPGLVRGTVVQPGSVCGEAGEPTLHLAECGSGPDAAGPLIITIDRIAGTTAEKAALAAATGGALVDMETLAVAEVARRAGIACHGIRVVSDAATDELPPDVGRLVQPQSTARRVGPLLGMLGRRPRSATDLWQLWERAVVDGRSLAIALGEFVAALADGPD